MNAEIARIRCLIAEAEKQERLFDAKCKGAIFLIRNLLNPYEDDITLLDTGQALQAAKALDMDRNGLKTLREKIRRMKADLS